MGTRIVARPPDVCAQDWSSVTSPHFLARHIGADLPRLRHVKAQKSAALPANVHVEEFYLQSGASL